MKKSILTLILTISCLGATAQIVTKADFEAIDMTQFDLNGDGKVKDQEAAEAIKNLYALDKNNAITRVEIVDSIPKTKEQIYVDVNNWFVHSFNDGKSVIQFNDKEQGVIIGKGYVANMGSTLSFASNVDISAWVIIKVDLKDRKMRITTTIQSYEMEKGMGWLGAIAGGAAATQKQHVELIPSECFPYTKKHKKEGAKALVQGHLFSVIIIEHLKEAVLNGLTGTEEDW